jgi:hypothetical protein
MPMKKAMACDRGVLELAAPSPTMRHASHTTPPLMFALGPRLVLLLRGDFKSMTLGAGPFVNIVLQKTPCRLTGWMWGG